MVVVARSCDFVVSRRQFKSMIHPTWEQTQILIYPVQFEIPIDHNQVSHQNKYVPKPNKYATKGLLATSHLVA